MATTTNLLLFAPSGLLLFALHTPQAKQYIDVPNVIQVDRIRVIATLDIPPQIAKECALLYQQGKQREQIEQCIQSINQPTVQRTFKQTEKYKASQKAKGKESTPQVKKEVLDFSDTKHSDTSTLSQFIDINALEAVRAGNYTAPTLPKKTSTFSWLSKLTSKTIDQNTIEPIISTFRNHLSGKNIAANISEQITAKVQAKLLGLSTKRFDNLHKHVQDEIRSVLTDILTPTQNTELLADIARKKPYVLTFIGTNGVGKSTNLSKICFYLMQNNLRVLIAACDTFRAGAVEQLKTHVRNLSEAKVGHVELFEKGYGKDSAAIAQQAIAYAKENQIDVVLVDTAGRMQDNEPLMRALAKLVSVNRPDKILFVGEALVGNESLDQLSKFNAALKRYSDDPNPRQIDGIVLSKFDTVDHKVGSAVNMSFITGKPIVFIGVGQTYMDLRKLQVDDVVDMLLD